MSQSSRFIGSGGVIEDTQTRLHWAREDSWQREAKWVSWDEAVEHARHLCRLRHGGFEDWRLPTRAEAGSLYDPAQTNQDRYGEVIHLHPVFPAGPLATIWLHEPGGGNDGVIFDFRTGAVSSKFKSVAARMAARPVRGAPYGEAG